MPKTAQAAPQISAPAQLPCSPARPDGEVDERPVPDRERCLGEGAGGVTSEACTTRREVALKRGVTGGERQLGRGGLRDDSYIRRLDDELSGDLVAEAALGGGDEHRVPRLQLVQAVEGGAVSGPVPGNCRIPRLSRQWGPRVMSGAQVEIARGRPLDHDRVQPDPRDLEYPYRLTFRRNGARGRRLHPRGAERGRGRRALSGSGG